MTTAQGSRIKKQLLDLIDKIESGESGEVVSGGETTDDDLSKINFKFGEEPVKTDDDSEKT
jgi:hypothetical protein